MFAVHQSDAVLTGMDAWNTGTHGRSGLTDRVKASTVDEATAERETIAFLQRYVGRGKSPMCGNSICQDRRFLANYMPTLEAFFHYRNLDVSTLKELARRWKPEVLRRLQEGAGAHRAGRHPGIDRRTRLLPGALAARLSRGSAAPQRNRGYNLGLPQHCPAPRCRSNGDSLIPSDRSRPLAVPKFLRRSAAMPSHPSAERIATLAPGPRGRALRARRAQAAALAFDDREDHDFRIPGPARARHPRPGRCRLRRSDHRASRGHSAGDRRRRPDGRRRHRQRQDRLLHAAGAAAHPRRPRRQRASAARRASSTARACWC